MQAKLYPIINHVVKFGLTIEKYDRVVYHRDKRDSAQKEVTCRKCLATYYISAHACCPRCGAANSERYGLVRAGKIISRKINQQLKSEFKHAPYGFPVDLEVVYLHAGGNNQFDLDNILNVVMSIINGSIVFDDSLVHDLRVRYFTGNGTDSQIIVTVSPWVDSKSKLSFTPSDIAALVTLQNRFAGKTVYVPKNIQKLFTICEADVRAKLWPIFEQVKQVGVSYMNLIPSVKNSGEDMKYLTHKQIIEEYKNWRNANGKIKGVRKKHDVR